MDIKMGLVIITIVGVTMADPTTANTIHVVGDSFGWAVPPRGPPFYATWAATQTFSLGDILLFNYTKGKTDVVRVTGEGFRSCNSKNYPIIVETNGPSNFTLDSIGEYYFIPNSHKNCLLGQNLFINVTTSYNSNDGPIPSPFPRGPVNYTVGEAMGWTTPPTGALAYATWAHPNSFFLGDTLVFNFDNKTNDVAEVTKEDYESCNISSTLAVYRNSPAYIGLKNVGDHYYTSTYQQRCRLGQKLTLHVKESSSSSSAPSHSIAASPSASATYGSGPTASPPINSAPSTNAVGYFIAILILSVMVLHLV